MSTDSKEESPLWAYKPCKGGHKFMWASNNSTDKYPPKGVTCECGAIASDGEGGILHDH